MFYAHFVLSKKGPLARIWLAAHWDKKLTKAHVFETNIEGSVEAIIQPKVKLALRTSGHLLLGVVRIYSRKAKYLLADCNEAFVKIKMAFRPGVVDLPEENKEAAVAAITLPETFHDFESTMADLSDIDVHAQFSVNQSRPEEITMREDLGNIMLVGEDGFGDIGFGEKVDIDLPSGGEGLDYEGPAGMEDDDNDDNDVGDFGGGLDTGLFDNIGGGLFEEDTTTTLAAAAPKTPAPRPEAPEDMDVDNDDDDDGDNDVGDDVGDDFGELDTGLFDNLGGGLFVDASLTSAGSKTPAQRPEIPTEPTEPEPPADQTLQTTNVKEQTTLISNEGDAFALEPIDITSLGTERKAKRRRKLVIDEQKGIPSETMKMQLSDTSEIVTTLDLAPPTKKLMHWKETGGVEKLFALPGRPLISKKMQQKFNANLLTKAMKEEMMAERVETRRQEIEEVEVARQSRPSEAPQPREEASLIDTSNIVGVSQIANISEQPSIENESNISRKPAPLEVTEDSIQMQTMRPNYSDDEDNDVLPMGGDDYDDDDIASQPSLDLNEELQDMPPEDERQEPGETLDEFEQRRWKGRTQQLMHVITRGLKSHNQVSFQDIISRNNRKQVASKFYTLLVLKKLQAVDLNQDEPYGDITIKPGANLASVP